MFKPYGVSLHITPRIQKNGNVRSKIDVEVSSVDGSMALNGGPALKTRRTSTEFNVQSGQTLVLAGFVSRDQFRNADKLPGMGDLPILGALFRSNRFQRNETELAIFVRPVVVSADNRDLQKRAARSRAIIDETFNSAPILNTPVAADRSDESQAARASVKRHYPIWIPQGSGGSIRANCRLRTVPVVWQGTVPTGLDTSALCRYGCATPDGSRFYDCSYPI